MPTTLFDRIKEHYELLLEDLQLLDTTRNGEQAGNPARTVKSTYAEELRDIYLRVASDLADKPIT